MVLESGSSIDSITLPAAAITETLLVLQEFGRRSEEGLVLWLGTIHGRKATVTHIVTPDQQPIFSESGIGYFVTGETLFQLNKQFLELGVQLLAQVHSHPGAAYHSDADDRFAIVTLQGGASLVVPNFGHASTRLTSWANYRLVGKDWEKMTDDDVTSYFQVI